MQLFDPDGPVARKGDPVTSVIAARSVSGLREKQAAVLAMFGGPYTDEELWEAYTRAASAGVVPVQSVSGLRTRRSELARKGLLVAVGFGRSVSGRPATLWGRPQAEDGAA